MAAKRILIIDDDVELCEEIRDLLQSQECKAECIYDAVKGEEFIRGNRYDAILLDFKMPLLSGIDVLKKLKADNIRRRIFIFSGRPSVERALKEADVMDMVSGIIAKPIDLEFLLNKIKQL